MKISLLLLFVVLVILAAVFLPVEQILYGIQDWSSQAGLFAYVALAGLFAVWVILLLPTSPYMLLAGFLFGPFKGFVVVWIGGLIGSTVAYWLARTVARHWIERRIQRQAYFMALDRAIERRGLLVVLLSRMVMVVPYQLLNYMLGLTNVQTRHYLIGTNTGMILPFLLLTFLGNTASDVAAIMRGDLTLGRTEWILFGAVFLTVISLIFLTLRVASKTLREELLKAEQNSTS